ncbi:hypothetical protein HET73_04655 [Wolbachia endosymbiont of Atemnus politus]|uniref:hypothetical protein n=1 Tax=Wolbachia endosymbiont of Atemnus politus TaxID=2682840 RepID=UPI001574B631|nr:hypothetical protein [Wolbachia endosymbiont of Atemnus politus]NSM56706.1 hypothetical protein [Wolbachia endosymbiont of Atemnus politus]NSX83236.1 hypothetical protein [Wolbachia endosymbiont of Atemnus politus]
MLVNTPRVYVIPFNFSLSESLGPLIIVAAFRERTGKTQGIKLSITPPINANAKFIRNPTILYVTKTTIHFEVKESA